jgi:hypothetical protein
MCQTLWAMTFLLRVDNPNGRLAQSVQAWFETREVLRDNGTINAYLGIDSRNPIKHADSADQCAASGNHPRKGRGVG